MSISVYSQQQDLAVSPQPEHEITRRLSILIIKAGLARPVDSHSIQLTSSRTWPEIKKLARSLVDPIFLDLSPTFAIRDYPEQLTCMEEAFQRCMRYPVDLAKEQRSTCYSWERFLPQISAHSAVQP